MDKGKVIAFANQKGGVGKTTTIVNFAVSLADKGKRVLIIDLDTQANTTQYCGIAEPDKLNYTIGHALNEVLESGEFNRSNITFARHHRSPNLWILGANVQLHKIKTKLSQDMIMGQRALKEVVDPLRKGFDYILIDCAPSLDIDLVNALVASDEVMIVTTASTYSFEGAEELMRTVHKVKKAFNPDLKLSGAVINCFDGRSKFSPAMESLMRERWDDGVGIRVFQTRIPKSIRVEESQCQSLPMKFYAPKNKVTESYDALVDEYLKVEGENTSEI